MPSYRALGITVAGIYDIDRARAEQLARQFAIPRVYDSYDEVLGDAAIDTLDIALPAPVQPPVVARALHARRHVLAQKPLALDSTVAAQLVTEAARNGVHLCVNQQARYDEGIMAARAMIRRGWIGEPVGVEMSVIRRSVWRTWYNDVDRLELWYHSIHELDAIRSWLGTPESVWCSGGTVPGQPSAGETNVYCGLRFSDRLHGMYHATNENRAATNFTHFRIDGTEGAIEGDLGRFDDTVTTRNGRPDALRVSSRTHTGGAWLTYSCTKRWFLDAFAGPIGSLFRAIATGADDPAPADNVETIRLIEALYRSMDTGEAQRIAVP